MGAEGPERGQWRPFFAGFSLARQRLEEVAKAQPMAESWELSLARVA